MNGSTPQTKKWLETVLEQWFSILVLRIHIKYKTNTHINSSNALQKGEEWARILLFCILIIKVLYPLLKVSLLIPHFFEVHLKNWYAYYFYI